MIMEMFVRRFPKIAEKETRCITLPRGNSIAAGSDYMAESFCNDKKCDCRRAFINVIYNDDIVATIGFGWEDQKFDEEWAHDKSIDPDLNGPVLELGGVHTTYAKNILILFKAFMMQDQIFIERLKKHYKMFKEAL